MNLLQRAGITGPQRRDTGQPERLQGRAKLYEPGKESYEAFGVRWNQAGETMGLGRAMKDTDFDAERNWRGDRAQARTAEVQVVAWSAQTSGNALQKEIDELKAKMTAMSEQMNAPCQSTGYKRKKLHQGQGKAKGPFLCYGCKEEGHMKRHCPRTAVKDGYFDACGLQAPPEALPWYQ